MLGFHLRLSFGCPGCGQAVPLDAMAPVVSCGRCGRGVAIELAEWKRLIETVVLQAARGQASVSAPLPGASATGVAARRAPRCRCRALLTERALETAGGAQPWLQHRCGAYVPVRSFPELDTIARVCGESTPSAPSPPGTGFVVTLQGWLAERVRTLGSCVEQALVDAEGNLYFAGSHSEASVDEEEELEEPVEDDADDADDAGDDEDDKEDDEEPECSVYTAWSCDAALRLRWKVGLPSECVRMAMLAPGSITYVLDESPEPMTLSIADGSGFGALPEVQQLAGYQQALRDLDGTWVVTTSETVTRLDPAQGWKPIPLFAVEGFFARLASSDTLTFDWGASIAIASDGDLVVHHADMKQQQPQISRFDRRGHRKLSVPSPLGVTFGRDGRLTTGVGGIVWACGGSLCAVTPTGVEPVALPPDAEGLLAAVIATTDGSLLFFGQEGRMGRATMNGTGIARWEVVEASGAPHP